MTEIMKPFLIALLPAAIIAAASDILLSVRPWGFGFLLWTLVVLATILVVAQVIGRVHNRWALWLILPILLLAADVFVYANPVTHVLAPAIVFLLLTIFIFWLTGARIPYRAITELIPLRFFERFAEAIASIPDAFTGLGFTRTTSRALVGLLIAAPFLLLFSLLFASSDAVWDDLLARLFDIQSIPKIIAHTVRIVVITLLAGGLLAATWKKAHADEGRPLCTFDVGAALTSFLAAINLLFVTFVTVQIVYLFGGKSYLRAHDLTFSEYARSGFFELLAVALVVFCIAGLAMRLYRPTATSRVLLVALLIQTGFVAASALRRLGFYVEEYGLTMSRFYAAAVMIFLCLAFLTLAIATIVRWAYPQLEKILAPLVIISAVVVLTLNAEGIVARTNVNRARLGGGPDIDLDYLRNLSADAAPAYRAYCSEDGTCYGRLKNPWSNPPRGWREWNLSRTRAATMVK